MNVTHPGRHERMTADRVQSAQSSVHRFVRGKKDPAKMTHAKVALAERGLGTERAHAKFRVSDDDGTSVCVGRGAVRCVHARVQSVRGAPHPLSWPP